MISPRTGGKFRYPSIRPPLVGYFKLSVMVREFHRQPPSPPENRNGVPQAGGPGSGFSNWVLLFLSFLKLSCSTPIRSCVFVFELLRIHFDAHAFLLVGNFFESSDVVRGTLLEAFVPGNHDGSGQEVALQSNGVLVVFPL